MHPIKYQVIDEAGLYKETWLYYPLEQISGNDQSIHLRLDEYTAESRVSKRHGWKTSAQWRRGSERYWEKSHIDRGDVPVRDEVRQAVLKRFLDSVTIE